MGFIIIDAHSHLWLKQDTVVEGLPIRTLENGRSLFMGEVRQMLPPFMTDGVNSAEVFLSNMDYAQVSAAVVTVFRMTIWLRLRPVIPTVSLYAECVSSVSRAIWIRRVSLLHGDSRGLRFLHSACCFRKGV